MDTFERFGFIAMLTVLGVLLLYFYSVAADTGLFTQWVSLERPPEEVTQVLAPDYVVTTSGNAYQHLRSCIENCWQRIEIDANNLDPLLPIEACGWMPNTSRYSQAIATCESYGPGGTGTLILAIDQQGGVYSWEHFKGERGALMIAMSPCIGAILGFGSGVIILILSWVIRILKPRSS